MELLSSKDNYIRFILSDETFGANPVIATSDTSPVDENGYPIIEYSAVGSLSNTITITTDNIAVSTTENLTTTLNNLIDRINRLENSLNNS